MWKFRVRADSRQAAVQDSYHDGGIFLRAQTHDSRYCPTPLHPVTILPRECTCVPVPRFPIRQDAGLHRVHLPCTIVL